MGSNYIFIQKAEHFLEELSGVELVPFQSRYFIDDLHGESLEEWHDDYFAVLSELKDINHHMELMFVEFGKGAYFLGKLNDFIPENQDVGKFYLHHLMKINQMFIEFLYQLEI